MSTPRLYGPDDRPIQLADDDRPPRRSVLASTVIPPRYQTGLQNVLEAMPNPDEILQSEGPETYTRMFESDGHVASIVTQRMRRVTGRGWSIRPFDDSPRAKEIAESVQQIFLRELNVPSDVRHFAKAIVTGFAVGEAVWRIEDTAILESIKQRHYSRFEFRRDGVPLLRTGPGPDRPLDEAFKFVVHRNDEEAENPYGSSILRPCYWAWRFKLMNWESWLTVLQRFGVPSLAVLFEAGADEEKAKATANLLTDQLLSVSGGGAGAFANVTALQQIEATGRGEDFDLLRRACNEEMTEAVLTSTLTTNTGTNGNRALGEVHEDNVERNVAETDREMLATTMTRAPVRWQAVLRFGEDGRRLPPSFAFDENKTADWSQVKEAGELGVPLDLDALSGDFNIPIDRDPKTAFVRDRQPARVETGIDLAHGADGSRTFFVFRGGQPVRFE